MHSLPAVCIVAFVFMQYLHHFLLSVECQVVLFHKKGCILDFFGTQPFLLFFYNAFFIIPQNLAKPDTKFSCSPCIRLAKLPSISGRCG